MMNKIHHTQGELMLDKLNSCPTCGYEGHDLTCPICNGKMESLEEETQSVGEKNEGHEVIDEEVSLEEEQAKEIKEDAKEDQDL